MPHLQETGPSSGREADPQVLREGDEEGWLVKSARISYFKSAFVSDPGAGGDEN
jgi:hypothetical protein